VTQYADEAWNSIQALFDSETRSALADRVDEILDLLDAGGTDARARRHRTLSLNRWTVPVRGSGEDWLIIWHPDSQTAEPYVIYAGPAPLGY
jgi:hypothetical protein